MGEVAHTPAYAGVDTHKDTNMLGLKDALGRTIGAWEFLATPEGYADMAVKIADVSIPVGIEGTRSYGAGLARYLASQGFEVYEAIKPKREQRHRGKSDAGDALAAAGNMAAGKRSKVKETAGGVESIRWLMVAREQLIRHMTQLSNCVDGMLVTAPDEVRLRWREGGEPRMRGLAATRPSNDVGRVLHLMAKRWIEASKQAEELEGKIERLVVASFPRVIGASCVGAISAARLILAAGSNPERMKSEAAFSMLCGTSPIPASSGKIERHRLNRGGDRQANRAIHEIARARLAHDKRSRAYVSKKMAQGKSRREAIRCLCRYIAREMFGLLAADQTPLGDPARLAQRRKKLGLTQKQAAKGAGITASKLGRLERKIEYDDASLVKYADYLAAAEDGALAEIED